MGCMQLSQLEPPCSVSKEFYWAARRYGWTSPWIGTSS